MLAGTNPPISGVAWATLMLEIFKVVKSAKSPKGPAQTVEWHTTIHQRMSNLLVAVNENCKSNHKV